MNGMGYELSTITDHFKSLDQAYNFLNRDFKIFLLSQFGDEIDLPTPVRQTSQGWYLLYPNMWWLKVFIPLNLIRLVLV